MFQHSQIGKPSRLAYLNTPAIQTIIDKTHKPLVYFNINSNYAKIIKIIENKLSILNTRKEIKYNKG